MFIDGSGSQPPFERWELYKYDLTQFLKRWSKTIAIQKKELRLNLLVDIEANQHRITQNPLDLQAIEELEHSKTILYELDCEKTKQSIFRSRARWAKDGERNSKYFFSLEKRNYNLKTMTQLINDNGKVITDQKEILDEQKRFYSKLYTADKSVQFELHNAGSN